jgi:hypothetical protein
MEALGTMLLPLLISALTLTSLDVAAAPNPGPLRQVTYKVSVANKTYSGGEHFSGYSSASTVTTDNGTVTVAIMAVQGDALGIDVTELMNKTGRPATYTGSVSPNGVIFPPETIQDVTRELLQYFAPVIPADKLDVGSSWDVNENQGGVDIRTNYKVIKIDGTLLTVAEHQTVKIAAQNATFVTDGTIVLKPSLLVPVSGDIHRTISRVTVSGDTKTEASLHFERVSDSKDVPTPG